MSPERNGSERTELIRQRVLEEVKKLVGDQMSLDPTKIGESDHLEHDLGCDSLDVVEIMMEVEEHFGIHVPDEIGEDIRRIDQITDGVLRLLTEARAGS
jgi:acyl carrier protein